MQWQFHLGGGTGDYKKRPDSGSGLVAKTTEHIDKLNVGREQTTGVKNISRGLVV